jgi:hypothetical protein
VTQQGTQTNGTGVARQIVWNSEAANANVGSANQTFSSATGVNWQTSFYYEYNNDTLYFFSNESGTGRITIYSNVANNNVWTTVFSSTGGFTPTSVQGNQTYSISPAVTNTFDLCGDLVFTPRRGWLHITPRRVGANQSSQTAFSTLCSLQHPDTSNGIGTPFSFGNFTTNDIINSANGFPSHQITNGIRVFQTIWRSNTEARIVTLGDLYQNTAFNTYQTGRLLIKA